MADLATLRIAVDSRPVDQAANDLDELAASARRAEGATDSLTSSTRTTSAAMAGMSNAVRQARAAQDAAASAVAGIGGAARLSANQMTNLSYQVQDLAVQLASGAPPMMAFMQQGSQIAGIMQASQMGVMGFTKAVIASTAAALAAVAMNPVFLAIAATVGIVSAAVNMMADDITKSSGVTVTATDVMLGAFDVLRDYVANKVTAAFNYFGIDAGKAWETVVNYTRKGINIVIGLVSLVPRIFAEAFQVVPQIIEKVFSGDFSGALSLALSAARNIAVGTFKRDFIGDLSGTFRDAALNRATQRQAEGAGESVGRALGRGVGRGAREAVKAELGDLLTDIDQILVDAAKRMNASDIARQEMETTEFWDVIQKKGEAEVKAAQDAAKARAKTNDQMKKTVDYLDKMLGLDGNAGKLLGGLSKGFPEFFSKMSDAFGKLKGTLDNFLQGLGTTFKEIAGGAAAGGAAAKLTGGSAIGGQVGGAIGQEIGSSISALGKFGGPIGAIAGGILGGVIGGMLKKTKKASATIEAIGGEAAIASIKGNSGKMKAAAEGMANSLIDGLMGIANQFNATLGDLNVSIGQRNKTFRVDMTGQGRTKGMPSFKTEEEAVRYAMQQAIRDGAISGLRAGAQALLQAEGNLERQLEKALAFEGVFNRLAEATDPLNYNLGLLDKEFANLRKIFAEAGASAEDLAALEQLYGIERTKILEEYTAAVNDNNEAVQDAIELARQRQSLEARILDLQGDAAGALAIQRRLELEAMDESLRPLQKQIYALEDAAAMAEAAAAAEAERAAAIAAAEAERAAAISDAQSVLRDAYKREASVLQDTANNFRAMGKALREFANDIRGFIVGSNSMSRNLEQEFFATAQMARLGNAQAMEALPGLGRDLADFVMQNAPDRVSMIRQLAAIENEATAAADVADRRASIAELQLTALNQQVAQLVAIEEEVVTVAQAINRLTAVMAAANGVQAPPATASASSTVYDSNQVATFSSNANTSEQVSALRDEMKVALFQIAKNTGQTATQLIRWDGEGLPDARGY